MENYEKQRFASQVQQDLHYNLKSVWIDALSSPLMEFIGAIGIASIVAYGGYKVISGESTPGTFFSFLAGILALYQPVKSLSKVNNQIPKSTRRHQTGLRYAGASGRAISLACEAYVHSLTDIEELIRQKTPVMPLTEEMIVTAYRKKPKHDIKKFAQPQRKDYREIHRKEKPSRTGSILHDSEKAGRRRKS